jgi:hypothetical protein
MFVLFLSIFIFILLFSFYSVESFIGTDAVSILELNKDIPVTSVVLECVREPKNDAWINLADITLYDENDNKVKYWNSPNSVNMANGNLGYLNQWGPIRELYDDNIYTCGHSSTAPDKLTIQLNPPLKLSSVQITNRRDCCEERIMKYDLKLYNQLELIGVKPLTQLGERGKSVTYTIIKPIPKKITNCRRS